MEEPTLQLPEIQPFDWIDLDFDFTPYLPEGSLEDFPSAAANPLSSATPFPFPPQDNPDSPKNFLQYGKMMPAMKELPKELLRHDLKPDAFHQNILTSEANAKERARADEIFMIESEWSHLMTSFPQDLLCMLTPSGMFIRASESSKELVGYRPEQLVGANITNFIHINELPNFYDQLNLVVNAGKSCSLTHRFRCHDKSYVMLSATYYTLFSKLLGDSRCVIMRASPAPAGAGQSLVEPEEKKPEVIPLGKFTSRLTMEGIFSYVSPSITQVLGYPPQDVLGRSMYELIHTDELHTLSEIHSKVKNASSEEYTTRHQFKRWDGTFATVETTFKVFRNPVSMVAECILCNSVELSAQPLAPSDESSLVEKLRGEVQELRQLLVDRTIEIERLRKERDSLRSEAETEADKQRKRKRKPRTDLQCEQCGTRESPEWRKGPSGNQTLCNACGLRYAKKTKVKRPDDSSVPPLGPSSLSFTPLPVSSLSSLPGDQSDQS